MPHFFREQNIDQSWSSMSDERFRLVWVNSMDLIVIDVYYLSQQVM